MHSQPVEKAQQESLFEKICRLAKERDEKSLLEIVNKGFCLDVTKGKYRSPIQWLLEQKELPSAEFLMKNSKFKININTAVYAYASCGDVQKVNQLIAQGASQAWAAEGYAAGGFFTEADRLLPEVGVVWLAKGYALGGDADRVKDLVKDVPVNTRSGDSVFSDIIENYALGGHSKYVNEQPQHSWSAVYGYARGGFHEQVKELLAADKNYLYAAVLGYAHGGDTEQVEKRLAAHEGLRISEAVQRSALGGHTEQVNKLMAMTNKGTTYIYAYQGYYDGGHLSSYPSILRIMCLTDDEDLRELLAKQAQRQNNSIDTKELMGKAEKRNHIIKTYRLNYEESASFVVAQI